MGEKQELNVRKETFDMAVAWYQYFTYASGGVCAHREGTHVHGPTLSRVQLFGTRSVSIPGIRSGRRAACALFMVVESSNVCRIASQHIRRAVRLPGGRCVMNRASSRMCCEW